MTAAALGHGWSVLSRAISSYAPRSTSATLGLSFSSRPTTAAVDDVVDATTAEPNNRFFFEDQSEDYVTIASHSIPPSPSLLSVIEAKLPLQLPQHIPGDTSIFEDSTTYIPLELPRYHPASLSQVISNLLTLKQFDEAYEYLKEAHNSDIELPRSYVYEHAAQATITSSTLSEDERITRFTTWLKMFPAAHETFQRKLRRSRWLLFQTPHSTPTLAIQFSLIMAEKGYAPVVSLDAVPFIVRFAPPASSLRFIEEFMKNDSAYLEKTLDAMESGKVEHTAAQKTWLQSRVLSRRGEMASLVQGPAIMGLARRDYFEEALSLLPTPKNSFPLPCNVYSTLLRRLRDARPPTFAEHIKHVEALSHEPVYCSSLKRTLYPDSEDLTILERELNPSSNQYVGEQLATGLQSLISDIKHSDMSVPKLVAFLSNYYDTGRTMAVVRLRRLALRRSIAGEFLYAEMSYYLNLGHPLLVLKTFLNFFSVYGIPTEDVDAAIRYLEDNEEGYPSHPAYKVKQHFITHRVWAVRHHTDLVWLSLARVAPWQWVEELYNKFIEFYKRTTPNESAASRGSRRNAIPVSPQVFTVFLQRLHRADQPTYALQIFRDMTSIGINPTIHHFTLMATNFARANDVSRALSVVLALERAHPIQQQQDMQYRGEPREGCDAGIPYPDVVHYTSILGAFIRRKHLKEARHIKQLVFDRFRYSHGVHPPLDRTFEWLVDLERRIENQSTSFQGRGDNPQD